MNNEAFMKAFGSHCGAMEKMCEATASTFKEMSACQKAAVDAGLAKATARDHHMDLHDCFKAAGESWGKLKDKCAKVNDSEFIKAVVGATMSAVDEKYGSMVVPTGVHKVLRLEDPLAPAPGSSLVPRAGGMSVTVDADRIDPQFRNLFTE